MGLYQHSRNKISFNQKVILAGAGANQRVYPHRYGHRKIYIVFVKDDAYCVLLGLRHLFFTAVARRRRRRRENIKF